MAPEDAPTAAKAVRARPSKGNERATETRRILGVGMRNVRVEPAKSGSWFEMTLPPGIGPDGALRLLSVFSRLATLRIGAGGSLEAFCTDAAEAAQVNAELQVAIADQCLRSEIAQRAAPEISALVDGVLNRATTA